MVAVPAALPVTSPVEDTPATPQALDTQATDRPDSTSPAESFSVAVSWSVCPTGRLAEAGLMLTEATGTRFTVTAALPLCPSLVAVMVTAPGATPFTSPVADTVATAEALDTQVTDRPESTLPAESFSVVVSCTVAPTSTMAVAGLITTDATGTLATLIAADPLFPSLVAVIVADPAATPVTSPLADTVATAAFPLVHGTAPPARMFPAASSSVAVSCTVPPTYTFGTVGLTVTDATGTVDTVSAAVPLCPS